VEAAALEAGVAGQIIAAAEAVVAPMSGDKSKIVVVLTANSD
jgi:phage gp45-like